MSAKKSINTAEAVNTEARKRRREWLIVILIIGLVALSLRYQWQLFALTNEIPIAGNILVLALINLNILLIILCLFLGMRNIFKLLLERRRGVPGARLRSKLVLAFIALSLIPTMLLFSYLQGSSPTPSRTGSTARLKNLSRSHSKLLRPITKIQPATPSITLNKFP
jgi:two-component system nitrogen regulation sensor histidine kinase NtrY